MSKYKPGDKVWIPALQKSGTVKHASVYHYPDRTIDGIVYHDKSAIYSVETEQGISPFLESQLTELLIVNYPVFKLGEPVNIPSLEDTGYILEIDDNSLAEGKPMYKVESSHGIWWMHGTALEKVSTEQVKDALRASSIMSRVERINDRITQLKRNTKTEQTPKRQALETNVKRLRQILKGILKDKRDLEKRVGVRIREREYQFLLPIINRTTNPVECDRWEFE